MENPKAPTVRWAVLLCVVWVTASCGATSGAEEAPSGRSTVTEAVLEPQRWLSVEVAPRFEALAAYDFAADPRYAAEVAPYLERRGVRDPDDQAARVRADFHNLAHALTILFETDPQLVLDMTLPPTLAELFVNDNLQGDHVGRELFGPLPFYLGAMHDTVEELSLVHVPLDPGAYVTRDGDLLFPSTSVVRDLRKVDPTLSGVTIARIYFRDDDGDDDGDEPVRCVELFQSAQLGGADPQHDDFMLARSAILYADIDERLGQRVDFQRTDGFIGSHGEIPPVSPISHIALRANDIATVYEVQRRSENDETGGVRPYIDEVFYNAADRSTNAKIVVRAPGAVPVFNRIVEVIHYGDP